MGYRINSTGRKKILREFISIRLLPSTDGDVQSFDADINIPKSLGLDHAAKVYVEPYVKSSTMRFSFGTVGEIKKPDSCRLTEIDVGASVLFRVKVVDESKDVGQILASANGIRADGDESGNNRKSLLPIRALDLGEEMWRLEVDRDAGPELLLNNRIVDVVDRIKVDLVLQATIYPEVVRQIARYILSMNDDIPDDAEWLADWTSWISKTIGREVDEGELGDAESIEGVVGIVVERFSKSRRCVSRLVALESL